MYTDLIFDLEKAAQRNVVLLLIIFTTLPNVMLDQLCYELPAAR